MNLPRAEGGVDPRVRAQMNRFVEGLCMGLGSTQAAIFAGVAAKSAARRGQKWRVDSYVRARFVELREKLTRDEICSFAELALNVKSMAFDEMTNTTDRIRASRLMADLMGMRPLEPGEDRVRLPAGIELGNRPLLDVISEIARHRLGNDQMTENELQKWTSTFLSIDKIKLQLVLSLLGKNVQSKTPDEIQAMIDGVAPHSALETPPGEAKP